MLKHGFHFSYRADPFAARKLVDFRRDDRRVLDRIAQPPPGIEVALQTRMPGVDEQDRTDAGRIGRIGWTGRSFSFLPFLPLPPKVRPRQLVELACGLSAAARVTVPRQIDEIERGRRAPLDAIKVRQPRLARCRARSRHPLPDERVDERRLADIRAADERNLRSGIARKIVRDGCAPHEGSFDFQWLKADG